MPSWHLDEGLATLRAEWKRDHPSAVVYTIGDPAHAARDSEHNPEKAGSQPGADAGEVDAADFMKGNGVTVADLETLFEGLHQARDPRILYVIYNRRIYSSVVRPWEIRKYNGSDPHTGHLHVSVNDKFDDNTSDWQWEKAVGRKITFSPITSTLPSLQYGDDDDAYSGYNLIARVQAIANWLDGEGSARLDIDGVYGAKTAAKLARVVPGIGNGKRLSVAALKQLLGLA